MLRTGPSPYRKETHILRFCRSSFFCGFVVIAVVFVVAVLVLVFSVNLVYAVLFSI